MSNIENQTPFKPTWNWLMSNKIAFVAFGFGSGLAPKAQGTWGSLVGMLLAGLLLGCGLSKWGLFVVAVLSLVVGVWICNQTERAMGNIHDHRGIVWDEIVGMFFVYAMIPQGFWWWLFGFVAFRFFDIVKPQPIGVLDKSVRGGLGVMIDDVGASVYAVIVVQLINLIF